MNFKKKNKVEVLVVGSDDFFVKFNDLDVNIRCIKDPKSIFPSLYMFSPKAIVVEYDHFKDAFHHYLVRIRTNTFYDKLNVFCCLSKPDAGLVEYLKNWRSQPIMINEIAENSRRFLINKNKLL